MGGYVGKSFSHTIAFPFPLGMLRAWDFCSLFLRWYVESLNHAIPPIFGRSPSVTFTRRHDVRLCKPSGGSDSQSNFRAPRAGDQSPQQFFVGWSFSDPLDSLEGPTRGGLSQRLVDIQPPASR